MKLNFYLYLSYFIFYLYNKRMANKWSQIVGEKAEESCLMEGCGMCYYFHTHNNFLSVFCSFCIDYHYSDNNLTPYEKICFHFNWKQSLQYNYFHQAEKISDCISSYAYGCSCFYSHLLIAFQDSGLFISDVTFWGFAPFFRI